MGTWLPETCWATIRREIKNTKSDIWLVFLIHAELRCTVNHTSYLLSKTITLLGPTLWMHLVFLTVSSRDVSPCFCPAVQVLFCQLIITNLGCFFCCTEDGLSFLSFRSKLHLKEAVVKQMTPYSLVESYRPYWRKCCLHFLSWRWLHQCRPKRRKICNVYMVAYQQKSTFFLVTAFSTPDVTLIKK